VSSPQHIHDLIGAPIEPVRFDVGDLDHSISPAIDLDAFVNARWRAANPLPVERSCWDSFAILHERSLQVQATIAIEVAAMKTSRDHASRIVGDLWTSGMRAVDDATTLPLRQELQRIDSLATNAAVADYVCERHARGWGVLFHFDVTADFDDPRANLACISQAGLGLPDRDLYLDTRNSALRDQYQRHVAALLAWSGTPESKAQARAADVVVFETRLARATTSRQTLARDISQRQRRITLEEADRLSPHFSWRRFFHAQGVSPPATFSLAMPAFHAEWSALLQDVAPPIWHDYLTVHTLTSMATAAGSSLGALHHRFHEKILRGQDAPKPRWKQVIEAIDAHAGDAMGELYVARTFSERARRKAEDLVESLRTALGIRIEGLDWMSRATKQRALEKLAAMRAKIGHPLRWPDASAFHTSADDWLGNLLAARACEQRRKLARIGAAIDVDEWRMTPQTVNAGYDPQRNEIVFPAAILQPPFFDENADRALNFGGIGAVIAHEMSHGYDDQGSRFAADGRFENWWSDDDRARFDALAQRLIAQFDAATTTEGDAVNGRLTLGENIADFGGLAIAFDALCAVMENADEADPRLGGYDQRQRFFFAWATIWRQNLTPAEARTRLRIDPHAPARLRANMAPSNMLEFAQAFAHESAGAMARQETERVQIW
jgi:putative endopeptidase